jgi:hypothetical protein
MFVVYLIKKKEETERIKKKRECVRFVVISSLHVVVVVLFILLNVYLYLFLQICFFNCNCKIRIQKYSYVLFSAYSVWFM